MTRPRHAHGLAGFSLVEVVLVAAIMAVFAAIAVPRYTNSLMRYRCVAASRRVAADLQLAQQAARQASASRQVSFNTGAHTYQLQNVSSLDEQTANYDVDLKADPYQARIISADFGGDAVVIFDGYGTPDSDGAVVVQAGTEQRKIVVDADTGRVSIP